MENSNRRKFLIGSASATLTVYFGNSRLAHANPYHLGAFWRQATKVVKISTTQVVVKAIVYDTSLKIQVTQTVAKAALLDTSLKINTSQAVAKVAVLDSSHQIKTSQVVLKVAVRV